MRNFLSRLARDAGDIAVGYANAGVNVSRKGKLDFVSEADTATEDFIRSAIAREFPDDGFVGEESGPTDSRSGRTWVVDPIDGTHNFLVGLPFWGVSIGVIDSGRPIAAAVHCPPLLETLIAEEGGGVWLNDERLATASTGSATGDPLLLYGMQKPPCTDNDCEVIRFAQDELHGTYRRIASASVSLMHVVKGAGDIYVGVGDYAWDVCAGAIIAQFAGLRHSLSFSDLPSDRMLFLCAREEYFETTREWLFRAIFR